MGQSMTGNQHQMQLSKDPTDISECEFCWSKIKTCGMKIHQIYCRKRPQELLVEAEPHKFYILNDHIFLNILSFMSNQTLTKLQMITGDRYPNCENTLSKLCCSCENDNPAMLQGFCLDCDAKMNPAFKPLVTKREAKRLYGIADRELSAVPRDPRSICILDVFARVDLDRHMLQTYGSKMGWLRTIADRAWLERLSTPTGWRHGLGCGVRGVQAIVLACILCRQNVQCNNSGGLP